MLLDCKRTGKRYFCVSTAPPVKAVVKERRPSSGGIKPVQQVFYTEFKNETGLLPVLTKMALVNILLDLCNIFLMERFYVVFNTLMFL